MIKRAVTAFVVMFVCVVALYACVFFLTRTDNGFPEKDEAIINLFDGINDRDEEGFENSFPDYKWIRTEDKNKINTLYDDMTKTEIYFHADTIELLEETPLDETDMKKEYGLSATDSSERTVYIEYSLNDNGRLSRFSREIRIVTGKFLGRYFVFDFTTDEETVTKIGMANED